jgi:predicted transcriptional regulator
MSRTALPCYGQSYPSVGTLRRVWAAVTHTPCASVRELATRLDMAHGHVSRALRLLRDAGYIAFADRACRARTVIVPFVVAGS